MSTVGQSHSGLRAIFKCLTRDVASRRRCPDRPHGGGTTSAEWTDELKSAGRSTGHEGIGPDARRRPSREGTGPVTDHEYKPVTVSRRICAPASEIFQVLANPVRHLELDGSGMLRGAVSTEMISGVGDVFVIKMYYSKLGDYEMNNHVVDYELDRRIGWEPEAGRGHPDAAPSSAAEARRGHRWTYHLTPDGQNATIVTEIYDCSRAPEDERLGMDHGNVWVESMSETLERLNVLCTGQTC
jgi:hypothetical protein